MRYIFITGSSKGLGKSLAELFLKKSNTRVIGIARTNSIRDANYEHHTIDLSKKEELKDFKFTPIENADEIILINNAGQLDPIKKVGDFSIKSLDQHLKLNVMSPMILVNQFINNYKNLDCNKLIINISSGAGKNPIEGWGAYCSGKAALDMFSQVVELEQKEQQFPVKTIALSPGIIDTDMQEKIRASSKSDFKEVDRFINYYKSGELQSSIQTAEKIIRNLDVFYKTKEVLISIRDL